MGKAVEKAHQLLKLNGVLALQEFARGMVNGAIQSMTGDRYGKYVNVFADALI